MEVSGRRPAMEVSGRRPAIGRDDVDTSLLCDLCLSDDEHTNAEFYCSHCNEFLCGPCGRAHRKSSASKHHQLQNKDEMPKRKLPSTGENLCPKHGGELIKYYCSKNSVCYCSVCVTLEHSQCGAVLIDDVAKGYSASQEYVEVLQSVKDTEKQISEFNKVAKNNSDTAKKYFNGLVADVRQFRTEINARLDVLEQEINMEANKIQSADLKAAKYLSVLCTDISADLSEMTTSLTSVEKYEQSQQLFISTKKVQTKLREMKEKLDRWSQEGSRTYTFMRNENITETLNSVRALGTLEVEGNIERQTDSGPVLQNEITKCQTPKPSKHKKHASRTDRRYEFTGNTNAQPVKARFLKGIQMKQKQDKNDCLITGTVQIDAHTLAAVDCGNHSIKLVDINSNTVHAIYKLDHTPPIDITYTQNRMLVVTYDSHLTFLQYDWGLSLVKHVPMKPGCCGVTSYKDKLFITCKGKQPSVKVLSDEGEILQTIQYDDNGQNLFKCPEYITISKDGQTMFISESSQHSVTSLSLAGKVCHVYRHSDLDTPLGLTIDDKDNVYVAGCWSHNIHQITPQCTPVHVVERKADRICYPRTVLYNTTNNSLYISTSIVSSRPNFLYVYSLE